MPLALPFLPLPQTYAAWPVWSGSTTAPIRFAPMPKKAAVRLWHRARDFDRGTHEPGRHGGSVGHAALQVLHSLGRRDALSGHSRYRRIAQSPGNTA
jgi:hypothetical protein